MSNNRADSAPRQEVKMYAPEDVVIIGLDTEDGPSHPLYDGESNAAPLIEADVEFTKEHGILQAVCCKRDGDRLLVVYGRGRTRQLREANKRRKAEGQEPWFLPVKIIRGDESKLLALKHGENSHRRAINPLARAREAYDLAQQMPEAKAAVILGLGINQFRNVVKLLDLAPAVAKAVSKGEISATAAVDLTGLSEVEQTEKLAELLKASGGEKPTIRDVKAVVREANGKAPLLSPAQRITKMSEVITKLDDSATKDELWSTIRKIKSLLEDKAKKEKADKAEKAKKASRASAS